MTTESVKETYRKKAVPALREKFGYKSIMAVPRIEKVTLNTSFAKLAGAKVGEEAGKLAESIAADLAAISGQKPVLTKAKKSIASFKLREGAPIGLKVTLRGQKMYDFLDRLLHVVFPRSRDFQGIKLSCFDNQGNLNIGIPEHLFFPEISPERSKVSFGLEVILTTSAKSREEGLELFGQLGFPLSKQNHG